MKIQGKISLLIYGKNIDENIINEAFNISEAKFVVNDEISIFRPNSDCLWFYSSKILPKNLNESFDVFIKKISKGLHIVTKVDEISECFIELHLNSLATQMEVQINSKIIKKISDLNLNLVFSVLSWGMIEDSEEQFLL